MHEGYKCLDPYTGRIYISRGVFDEKWFHFAAHQSAIRANTLPIFYYFLSSIMGIMVILILIYFQLFLFYTRLILLCRRRCMIQGIQFLHRCPGLRLLFQARHPFLQGLRHATPIRQEPCRALPLHQHETCHVLPLHQVRHHAFHLARILYRPRTPLLLRG
jgi:hypothetical protein